MASSTSTMRALRMTKPDGATAPVLSFEAALPVPVPPPGHVLIRIHASGITPSDYLNLKGGFPSTTFPRIPGRDYSGVVVAAGDDAGASLVNTPVFGTSGSTHAFTVDGFQADYAVAPVSGVTPKPSSMSHVQAATVGVPFTTAALVVQKAGVKRGDAVMVLGANGSVGKSVCVVLEELGCRVIRAVRGSGGDVDTAADPELSTLRDVLAKGADQPAKTGVDAVIDTVGAPALTRAAVENGLGRDGTLVFIAAPRGGASTILGVDMFAFYRAEKNLRGVNTGLHSSTEMAALLHAMKGMFESGRWEQASSGTWTEVKLEDAASAYQNPEKGKKYVVTMV